ncbi:MAG: ABC transporter permease subunit [Aggregatilineales bacterium]
MTALRRAQTSIITGPIARAERAHQRRLFRRGRFLLAGYGACIGAIVTISLARFFETPIGGLLALPPEQISAAVQTTEALVMLMTSFLVLIAHLLIVLFALQTASASVAREKRARTWESLLLTTIDARQIVLGKWWATMQTTLHLYGWLLLWRGGVGLWLVATTQDAPAIALFGAGLLIAYPFFNMGIAAALGMLASTIARKEGTAQRLAAGLYFSMIAGGVLAALGVIALSPLDASTLWASALSLASFAPLDGGLLLFNQMLNTSAVMLPGPAVYTLATILFTAIGLALICSILLAAQRIAVWQRALPPEC